MSEADYDYLILGQGLAGSLLAWHLLHAGRRVLVIDDGHRSSSSKVAAGLVNPLAGMRFNCAPRTAQWLESAHAFYRSLGALYDRSYFHAIDMQRLFRSPEQARFYRRQLERPASQPAVLWQRIHRSPAPSKSCSATASVAQKIGSRPALPMAPPRQPVAGSAPGSRSL